MTKNIIRDIFYKYFPKRVVIDYIATRTINSSLKFE